MSQEHLRHVGQVVGHILDLPKEVILNLPRIIITGNMQVNIENHQGMVLYHREVIRVNSHIGQIVVEGKDMIVTAITSDEVYIEGSILRIYYDCQAL